MKKNLSFILGSLIFPSSAFATGIGPPDLGFIVYAIIIALFVGIPSIGLTVLLSFLASKYIAKCSFSSISLARRIAAHIILFIFSAALVVYVLLWWQYHYPPVSLSLFIIFSLFLSSALYAIYTVGIDSE